MARLKSHSSPPSGGFRFTTPNNNWSIRPWSTWESAIAQIIDFRRANPYLTNTHGWSLDPNVVSEELEAFNVAVCKGMGWTQFLTDGGPDPAPKMIPQSRLLPSGQLAAGVSNVVAGVKTIADWELAGGNVVSRELANERARTCSNCPKNTKGDLSDWFTEQAARLISLQLETRNNMKLHTNYDPLLGICEACSCVNKLSVWCPLDIKLKHMKPEAKAVLDSKCWVLSEEHAT